MEIISESAAMHARAAAWHADGKRIGFVPTMGAFHEGHLSLMRRARAECDIVVVSLFVNPTQFNDPADLAAYPRTEESDTAAARRERVDVVFAPTASDMYPAGAATTVAVGGLEDVLEGAMRGPQHFRGVATVVARLLNVVAPDLLYLGQKDAQQVAVIKRMATDLAFPVRIVVCPTIREPDGLAMSSRNVRLASSDRERALALRRGLDAALAVIDHGVRRAEAIARAGVDAMARLGVEPEYFAVVDAATLAPLEQLSGELDVLIAVAARVGPVRLIDNEVVHVSP
jgi:pantoate--beta-alanine ligase